MPGWIWAELTVVAAVTLGVAAGTLVWAARWLDGRESRGGLARCSTYFAAVLLPIAMEAAGCVAGLWLLGAL